MRVGQHQRQVELGSECVREQGQNHVTSCFEFIHGAASALGVIVAQSFSERLWRWREAKLGRDRPEAFAWCKTHYLVDAGMVLPQRRQLLWSQQSDVGLGETLAQPLQRGRRHDGIAQPVDAAD